MSIFQPRFCQFSYHRVSNKKFTLLTNMAFIISVFISSVLLKKSVALNQNYIYKAGESTVDYGSFQLYFYQYLSAKKINTSLVKDEMDCPFKCIGEPKCLSFNIAAFPDTKGFYLCELLANEKFGNGEKIQSNASFHHYSPVSIMPIIVLYQKRSCLTDLITTVSLTPNFSPYF